MGDVQSEKQKSEKQKHQAGKSTCNMYGCFSAGRSMVHSSQSVAIKRRILVFAYMCTNKIMVHTYTITYSNSIGE